jgi:O-Antigen ligase
LTAESSGSGMHRGESGLVLPARSWTRLGSPTSTWVFAALTVVCLAIPGLAVPKACLILGFWGYLVLTMPFSTSSAIWMGSVLGSLVFATVVSLFHSVRSVDTAGQFARMLLFFLILSIGALILRRDERLASGLGLDKLIGRATICSMLLKVAILAAVVAGWITFDKAQQIFGFESVTEDIGGSLQRLQFPSDVAVIFLVPCYRGGTSKLADAVFVVSTSIIVYTSFSRFLFAAFGLALLIRALWMRRMDTTFISALVLTAAVASVFAVNINSRFVGQANADSDNARVQQMRILSDHFVDNPIIGKGMGSSVPGFLRSVKEPYFYEVQWYAMAMQFGVLGLLWLFLNFSSFLMFQRMGLRDRRYAAAVVLLWAVSGFTNPFLTAVGGAFGICILVLRCRANESALAGRALAYAPISATAGAHA